MLAPRLKRWRLWTPADLNPLAWFDAKDGAYITESGGLVSQWNDKSGNARHIFQSNDANKPTYTADCVTFNGTSSYLFNTSPFMYANGNISVSFVGSCNPALGYDRRLVTEAFTLPNDSVYSPAENQDANPSKMCAFIRNNLGVVVRGHVALSALGAFNNTQRLYVWGDTGSRFVGNFNGGPLTQSDYTRAGTLNLNSFSIGCLRRQTAVYFWPGTVNELIIANFMPTQARLCMEGWLAWRWGLQGLLPADHRYKSEPPRVPLVT